MKNIDIVMECKDYSILYNWQATFTPWIVAYKIDKSDMTWKQGHYFSDKDRCYKYFIDTIRTSIQLD